MITKSRTQQHLTLRVDGSEGPWRSRVLLDDSPVNVEDIDSHPHTIECHASRQCRAGREAGVSDDLRETSDAGTADPDPAVAIEGAELLGYLRLLRRLNLLLLGSLPLLFSSPPLGGLVRLSLLLWPIRRTSVENRKLPEMTCLSFEGT